MGRPRLSHVTLHYMDALKQVNAASAAVEDYVKAIYQVAEDTGGVVTTTGLAARLGVTAPSVSAMVKRLDAMGLVAHAPYRGVVLSEQGRRLALSVVRRHRLLELFLAEALGLSWDQVHDQAEVLEHALSPELAAVIAEKLGHPDRDPHGDPIPTVDGRVVEEPTARLSTLAAGTAGVLVRVSDADPDKLRYLSAHGIGLGDSVEVGQRQPFGGSLSVRINGQLHTMGAELAAAMRVRVTG